MDALEQNPRVVGQKLEGLDQELWIYESPRVKRIPTFYVMYEIDDENGRVVLWGFSLASKQ